MLAGKGHQLISVQPNELKFIFELEKQSYCDLRVINNTEKHVAFKVKTTSPKKYFVRPNTGVVQPWDSCVIRVTLQAQKEAPPDLVCKDKFLLQSTVVPQHTDADELPPNTFNRESGNEIEERKLTVIYVSPTSSQIAGQEERGQGDGGSPETVATLQRLKEERDAAVKQTHQLRLELDMLRRLRNKKKASGFSLKIALMVGLIGIVLGFILKLYLSSSPELGATTNSEL